MTWSAIEPPAVAVTGASQITAVTLCGSVGKSGTNPVLTISIRPELMDHPPEWLADGSAVGIQIGRGEHAGLIRIVPSGRWTIRRFKTGKPSKHLILTLKVKGVPGTVKFKKRPASYDHSDTWLEIEAGLSSILSMFDDGPKSPAPVAQVVAGPPAKGKPFAMSGSGLDPMAAKRVAAIRGR